MIPAYGEIKKITDEIKMFDLYREEVDGGEILKIFNSFKAELSDSVIMSVNFSRDGDFIHGEGLLSRGGRSVVSRQMGLTIESVAMLLVTDMKKRVISLLAKN